MVVAPSFGGAYVQGAFALQWPTGDVKDAYNSGDISTNFLGGSLAGGAFLTDWLAVGGRVQIIDQRETTVNFVGGTGSLLAILYSANVKLYPFNLGGSGGLLQPYAIVGLGGQTTTATNCDFCSSDTSFLFELGGGLDVMLGDRFGLFAEFEYQLVTDYLSADIGSANQLGLLMGITYRF